MALERMALVSEAHADGVFEAGTQQRNALGHYLGGTLYYAAEWYWGIDRLPYLEERLSKSKLRHSGCRQISAFQERPAFMSKPAQGRLTVEFFPSARSLGHAPLSVLRHVHIPLLRPAVIVAALMVFVDVMKELPATLILRPFDFETLASSVYSYASLGAMDDAALPALIIIAVGLVPVGFVLGLLDRQSRI